MTTEAGSELRIFLIADVRGYTYYTQTRGDEAAARLARQFAALVRDRVAAHGGRVVELRGDEALAVFGSARGALRAAHAVQERYAAEQAAQPDLPAGIGIGLDAGEAIPVEDGYRGSALNLAARLCALAAPGEVLAGEAVIHLAGPLDGLAYLDHGMHALKGFPQPVHAIAVVPSTAAADRVPFTPAQPPTSGGTPLLLPPLPEASTPLVGRAEVVDAVCALLDDQNVRLLTLTGPGGTGKTRLALAVAHRRHDAVPPPYPDGVAFVSLAAVSDVTLVPTVLAAALSVAEVPNQPIADHLISVVGTRRLLVVLDNFEQILDAAPFLAILLSRCPHLTLLVTSRAALHLSREHEYPVAPLALPDLAHLPDPSALASFEAVALFVERARAVQPSFALTRANAAAVAEICVRLDGLPLAIELAAARLKLLPPATLLQRLAGVGAATSHLAVLVGGARDLPARQQTLRNTIAWSYDLLSPSEQALFARLSVFVGGCTLDAVEHVAGPPSREDSALPDTFELLASLVDKSLVLRHEDEESGEVRFLQLQTIREFAQSCLRERAEHDDACRGHALYFLALAEEAEPLLRGHDQQVWLGRLENELANLRAALTWARDSAETVLGLRLATALGDLWDVHGYHSEGRAWLETLLQQTAEVPSLVRARALFRAAVLASWQGDYGRAVPAARESLDLWRALDDRRGAAAALVTLGVITSVHGDHEAARAMYEESLAHCRATGDTWGAARALSNLATLLGDQDRFAAARAMYEESLALRRALGDTRGIARCLAALGHVAGFLADYTEAAALLEESLTLCRALGDKVNTADALASLAAVARQRGNLERAEGLAAEGLALFRDLSNRWGCADALRELGLIARDRGDHARAAALLAESLALGHELNDRSSIAWGMWGLGLVARDTGDLPRAAALAAEGLAIFRALRRSAGIAWSLWALGRAQHAAGESAAAAASLREALTAWQTLDSLMGVAPCFEGLACAAEPTPHAVRLMGAAAALRQRLETPQSPAEVPACDAALHALRRALDPADFAAAWAEGAALSPTAALALALSPA